jgi:hypothetical protein
MAVTSFTELHLAFDRWVGKILDHSQSQYLIAGAGVSLIAALFAVVSFLARSQTPNVPILLQDEIGNARKRALEYCFNPREVMAKGYRKVREIMLSRHDADTSSSKMKYLGSTHKTVGGILTVLINETNT